MKSELCNELEELVSTFKPSKAVYKISPGYRDNVYLRKVDYPRTDRTDFVASLIESRHRVGESLDLATGKHVLSNASCQDMVTNIRHEMIANLKHFIAVNGENKNNKLTATYRWFNEVVSVYHLRNNVDLENDLWNIFKWVNGNANADKKTAVQVLDIIRQRYEAKGIKL